MLPEDLDADLMRELNEVGFDAGGSVLLSTCGPRVRALARSYNAIGNMFDRAGPLPGPIVGSRPPADLRRLQSDLFEHFGELFVALVGGTHAAFQASAPSFEEAMRLVLAQMNRWGPERRRRWEESANGAMSKLAAFYREESGNIFRATKVLPGQRLVLGGTQRFTGSALRAVRQMALYADTLLIPDPVMPWVEKERPEERFTYIKIVEQLYYILQLRDLALVHDHPVVVFPSWEKLLEANDVQTQEGMERFCLALMNAHLPESFDDLEEFTRYVERNEDSFLRMVAHKALFVPPGGDGSQALPEAIASYREYLKGQRSDDYLRRAGRLTDAQLVATHIFDRLGPLYHLDENSREFGGLPLLTGPQHWHYFSLVQAANAVRSCGEDADSTRLLTTMRAMSDARHECLGAVPIPALVELRKAGANVQFRKQMDGVLSELKAAHEGQYESEVARVARAIDVLLAQHSREAAAMDEEYRNKLGSLLVSGGIGGAATWVTAAAKLLPWFPDSAVIAGGASISALGMLSKFTVDKVEQARRRRAARRTLLGYLAASRR